MDFYQTKYSAETLKELYQKLLYPRMIEEKMLLLLRQGKISKWFSGIGQEAIAVGATAALNSDEWIMPLHRNLGVFTTRNIPLHKLLRQWQGGLDGFSKGRERSFHFGSKEHFICGMISHLGAQLPVAAGAALSYKLQNKRKVALAFSGEGGTSEGDFHEAMNMAAVWDLPMIFLVEDNGYALSTPTHEQFRCKSIVDKAIGYGMEGVEINGNNILEVYDTISGVREYCINNQRPYLVVCNTFRMRGHEEASGVKYIPTELFEQWENENPIKNYEEYLLAKSIISTAEADEIKARFKATIESEVEKGFEVSASIVSHTDDELNDIYAPFDTREQGLVVLGNQDGGSSPCKKMRFLDAIKDALTLALNHYPNLIIMGQDIAEYGGAFKMTEGLVEKFGKEKIRNTPICESAVIGMGLGLSLENYKSVIEMQFADFVSVGFNQIVNNLAKIHYRWGQNAGVVIRMPTGGGVGAGPFHSQCNEAWFAHVPGLKIVYPSNPFDAKGLMMAAIADPNPVLFFEHKALYRSLSAEVAEEMYVIEIGKASIIQKGTSLAIITYGLGVQWALEYSGAHPEYSIEILDLRTLLPLDYAAIMETTVRCNKVIVLHEDTYTCGIGAEVAAWIGEHCFQYLDAPVMRCASLDTPVPFSAGLEKNFMANARLGEMIEQLMMY